MKKLKIMIAIVLCIIFSIPFSANTIVASEFYYQEEDITVTFEVESVFSEEQKQFIADKIISGEPFVDDGISTYSLCWLTGHDIVSEAVFAIEHKVRTDVPRCDKKTYRVDSCSKCDYLEYELVSEIYYACCPVE